MINRKDKNIARKRRQLRVRKKIQGSIERPRLNIFRSLKHIYVQIIDDEKGETLVAASSLDSVLHEGMKTYGNKQAARQVGELIAQKALEKGINEVVFDRAGYLYHGRVKALAEAARASGLIF